jgi:hypothetical protein
MISTAITEERNIANALISGLANMPETPTREQVEEKARQIAAIFGYVGELRNIVTEAMESVVTRMGAGVSLVDVDANHDEQWIYKRDDINWTYASAYDEFLRTEGWPPQMVQSLSDVTLRILGHLQDPLSNGTSWDRRGLVIGHVQSGKTANYTGLIARAADAGYKFIVVIAGIHNNLRRQTQERIDEAFIGQSSDPSNRRYIGVGLTPNYPHPGTLTNIHEDFNTNTADKSGLKINKYSAPIILVIKKNVTTLAALHKWLKELNTKGEGQIRDVPMLLIDDEADNASVNTNKEDIDPTRTNAKIREILSLFAKSCYVGYTATPFANIFINPDSYSNEVREDLFPRHFIYCLDAPTTYFGAEKVFLNEKTSKSVVRAIEDCEDFIPYSHKRDDPVYELPDSLYRAFDSFIVARAIRNLRGQVGKHCSMMVNVSRFVSVQKTVKDFLSLREKKIRAAVAANYAMPDHVSSKNTYMQGLKNAFDAEYIDTGCTWKDVKAELCNVFEHLHLYVINSKSDEVLDYKKYQKDGIGLTAIAIGGLSLSRGLTIEGLTVSYMYRNTRMYDTLMQMGRWFGYRLGYEDLCKVHLSSDSINWYSHIAESAEELAQQVRRMRRRGMTPREFGMYVNAHPDKVLIVTAANKMRSGEEIVINQNLTGRLIECTTLSFDSSINNDNEKLIERFFTQLENQAGPTDKGWFVPNVDIDEIESFIIQFKHHKDTAYQKSTILDYLETIKGEFPQGDILFISKGQSSQNPIKLGAQERTAKNASKDKWMLSGYRLASRGDEKLGLSEPQILAAELEAAEDDKSKTKTPSDYHYRLVRNKPLLMIHVLEPTDNFEFSGHRVPSFGVSYPDGLPGKEVRVVANRIWLEQNRGPNDDPDEDDHDD